MGHGRLHLLTDNTTLRKNEIMTRVAAIDCGTNSIRLLVADGVLKGNAIALNDLTRQMRIVRLGQGC